MPQMSQAEKQRIAAELGAKPIVTPAQKRAIAAQLGAVPIQTTSAAPPRASDPNRRLQSLMGIPDPRQQAENVKGALKSVGQTMLGGVLAVPQVVEAYGGPKEPEITRKMREGLKPTPEQETGASIGRFAQYAVPALATGGASLPVQMAAGGLGSAAIASGAGEDPVGSGVVGAASPALGAAIQRFVPGIRRSAEERVASAIGPRGMEAKKELSKVLPEITKRKPFAWSSEKLKDQFEAGAEKVALQLDDVIDKFAKGGDISKLPRGAARLSGPATGTMTGDILINTGRIARSIDPMIKSIARSGGGVTPEAQTVISQLKQIQNEIKEIGRIHAAFSKVSGQGATGLPPTIQKRSVGATIDRLRELKQRYGDIVAGTGKHFYRDAAEQSRAGAAKEGYHALRTSMVEAVPEAKELGKEYQRQAVVRDLLAKQELNQIAGTGGGVGRVAEAGAIAGGIVTASPKLAASGATLAALLKFTNSTPFKLASANLRTTFANAIEKGDVALASQIAGQMAIQAFGSEPK